MPKKLSAFTRQPKVETKKPANFRRSITRFDNQKSTKLQDSQKVVFNRGLTTTEKRTRKPNKVSDIKEATPSHMGSTLNLNVHTDVDKELFKKEMQSLAEKPIDMEPSHR